ncbi:cytochrome P450 [Boeremia exigua]|uniref:cytochrome P450 n=1 Tax=Boeremia exigua TaxID=749465 RepID=UPI001E8D8969|nr:cytochrome P450 [Boeremia exigua]KAH6625515.1 cytochrome P450 [Boeremia exigua]
MSSTLALPLLSLEHLVIEFNAHPLGYTLTVLLVAIFTYIFLSDSASKQPPLVNQASSLFSLGRTKRAFLTSSKDILDKARTLYPAQPYRVTSDLGEVLVLPPELADEIRNNPKLSLATATYNDLNGDLPGFDIAKIGSHGDAILQAVIKKQLTKSLVKTSEPMSEEAARAVATNLGYSPEWKEIKLRPAAFDIVTRVTSRVFVGEELCRDEHWLRVTQDYAMTVIVAATKLRMYPKFLRKFIYRFVPECNKARSLIDECRRVVMAVIDEREAATKAALQAGKPVPEWDDAISWAEHEALTRGTKYDPAVYQLTLSFAAIHSTSDLLAKVMLDIATHPEIIEPLRREISDSLRGQGWKKGSLYNMKLLDSVIKETQRVTPLLLATMRRRVEGNVVLSTGLKLKPGMRTIVETSRMRDPDIYNDPDKWDPYRFFNLRSDPVKGEHAQLVATGPDYLAFGHGEHACPGRFFAAHELKVAVCHLVMKYDWKLSSLPQSKTMLSGFSCFVNPTTTLMVRNAKHVEIDLDSI